MEGIAEEVTVEGIRLSLRHVARSFFFCTFLVLSPAAAQRSDFLIFKSPARLVLFDAFQRALTAPERASIPPMVPIRVLETQTRLSDGITPCMQVEIDGDVYFILRDETGRIANRDDAGLIGIYRDRLAEGDTIQALQPRSIRTRSGGAEHDRFAAQGEMFFRYFSTAAGTYVRSLSGKEEFAWVSLPATAEGVRWRRVRRSPDGVHIPAQARTRLLSKIREANDVLRTVFALLNEESSEGLIAPQWEVDSTSASLRISLRPTITGASFPVSRALLCEALQTYLVGTPFDARVAGAAIVVGSR